MHDKEGGKAVINREAVVALLRTHSSKSPLLVAIDGQSAAGKSILARYIQRHLPHVSIVHADDFYQVMDEHERARLDAEGGYTTYYDWQRLETHVLKPLVQGQPACYQLYDWSTGQLGDYVTVQPEGVILVEGLYTLRPELRPYFDVKIWVDTDFAQRMQRQGERTDPWEWVERWEAAEIFYIQQFTPEMYADIVVHP